VNDQSSTKGPDVGTADPTDGRKQYEWESKYPSEAVSKIRVEAVYVVILFFLSLSLILATWKGLSANIVGVAGNEAETLKKYCYYGFSGLLGGTIFSIKYLYRSVARGYWHLGRRLWRFLSPLTSLGLAFAIGALLEASIISVRTPASGPAVIGIGFLIGYFADSAVAKMHEVAEVLFGTTIRPKN